MEGAIRVFFVAFSAPVQHRDTIILNLQEKVVTLFRIYI